jgi:hypothetical protein
MFERKVVWKKSLEDCALRIDNKVVWLTDKKDYGQKVRIIGLKGSESALYIVTNCNNFKSLVCATREKSTFFSNRCSTLVMYSNSTLEVEIS